MMKFIVRRGVQLLLSVSLLLHAAAVLAQVEIQLRMLPEKGVELEYHVPTQCTQFRFDKDGPLARKIRESWIAADNCARIEGDELKFSSQCRIARFLVPASVNKVSGYPAAFPMGKAIYVHTSNYQLDAHCGEMRYTMMAPYLAFEGKVLANRAQYIPPADSSFPLLLSTRSISSEDGVLSYIDENLSPAYVERIQEVSRQTIKYLHTAMPKARFMMPIIAAANVPHPGAVGFDGDAGNVLRLGLFNWPTEYTPEGKKTIDDFVGHEFSHRFQKRDEVDIYPLSRLIHEGGGEYLRWHTALQLGWMNQQEAAQDLDNALNLCLLGVEQRAWQGLSRASIVGRQLEYRCGLAAYVFGLAARQNSRAGLNNVAEFYAQIQDGMRPDFADAIECGERMDCHPRWLPLLFFSATPMAKTWDEYFQKTGLARRVPPNQKQQDMMTKKVFSAVVTEDCGESSMFEASDGLIIDDLKACKRLKKGMKVVAVEGHPIFGHPDAFPSLIEACEKRKQLSLQLAKGETLQVSCATVHAPETNFYATNMAKLMRALQ